MVNHPFGTSYLFGDSYVAVGVVDFEPSKDDNYTAYVL